MEKKSIEKVLDRLSEMTDEEKKAILKEAKAATKDVEELADLIVSTVLAWMKHHEHDEGDMMARLVTGFSKGVCSLLVTFDEAFEDSGHQPSGTFIAMLPIGMSLAKMEREIHKKMEHERMMKEGVN
jgi:hypothetical protein